MPFAAAYSVKNFPFVKLFASLTAGIILQWYFHPNIEFTLYLTAFLFCLLIGFSFLSEAKRFNLNWLRGCFILLLFTCAGMLLVWRQNIQNNNLWFGKIYKPGNVVLVTLQEPLVEKSNSYKALASVDAVSINGQWRSTKGNILLYFKKNGLPPELQYGSQIIFNKPLQPIQNSGNPAALDYKRYCLFQNITNQGFLSGNDYIIAASTNKNFLRQFLFTTRDAALKTMQQNIHSPKELGIAEALLIGYRNDLDKDLVQAYSDTGVVHIIAISGMHIAIIYATLIWFFRLFKPSKLKKIIEPIIILAIIWMFTLIAGAAPSIARASVMFTCILIGKFINRNGNIYNTLAASAFILLVYNPFNLWDVGFQLSYAAVLSIVIFFRPINNIMYVQNKLLRKLWQLTSVTLAAQIFALPIVIYHFHQLPLMFLIGNLIAVPLSGFILYAELALFCFSWWHSAAAFIGFLIEYCIKFMNDFIQYMDRMSFSVLDGLHISLWQLIILLGFVIATSVWIFYKNKTALISALSFLLTFFILRDINFIQHSQQQKLIVYNVPKYTAIDFIGGNSCCFSGDSLVITNALLRNFNLKSSRVKDRISVNKNVLLPHFDNVILNCNNKKILLLDKPVSKVKSTIKIPVDVIIINGNIHNSVRELNEIFDCKTYIAVSNIAMWKSMQWKKDCEQLHLRFHSVAQQGASVIKM
jgi:competence protein ComEC